MYTQPPPNDPRNRQPKPTYTWQGLILTSALVTIAPLLLLWTLSEPLLAGAALVSAAGAVTVGRRAYRLTRCFYECGGFTVGLPGAAEVTVRRRPCDGAC
ncbi:hypothetical protein [Halovivax limisalsi]|uniref:hypothetical protein n=1 Tax=Halovivax limisalsi TaxID=1453760 RepID=UPI001FFCEAC8|nr:hypothetical protein [Halovivax limisalsi]